MTTCLSCGNDVTGRKFCSECGTPVRNTNPQAQGTASAICIHCGGNVKPGAAFCMHCGSALNVPVQATSITPPPPPAARPCPACHAQVPYSTVFCTQCGHDMRVELAAPATNGAFCTGCGRQNAAGVRFCGGCGGSLVAGTSTQSNYQQSQYQPQPQYQSGQYPQQSGQYPQQSGQYPQQSSQYPQQSGQYPQQSGQYPQQYAQGGYQPQPMLGQQPMAVRCPVCMAMAAVGTPNCPSCRTSLAGVVPTPAMQQQGQQSGMGGFLQGNGGKYAMGALGGAAAVLGGEMLLHGVENNIENRVDGDMGMGGFGRHHRRRDEGLLGGLGELVDDIGL